MSPSVLLNNVDVLNHRILRLFSSRCFWKDAPGRVAWITYFTFKFGIFRSVIGENRLLFTMLQILSRKPWKQLIFGLRPAPGIACCSFKIRCRALWRTNRPTLSRLLPTAFFEAGFSRCKYPHHILDKGVFFLFFSFSPPLFFFFFFLSSPSPPRNPPKLKKNPSDCS